MVNIDEIMEMLDWNQSDEVQEKGRELARKVKTLNAFLRPYYNGKSKSLWDNCAIILSEKTDKDLAPHFTSLIYWIQDLNWPGALIIFERLKNFKEVLIDNDIKRYIEEADLLKDEIWKENLQALYDARQTANK